LRPSVSISLPPFPFRAIFFRRLIREEGLSISIAFFISVLSSTLSSLSPMSFFPHPLTLSAVSFSFAAHSFCKWRVCFFPFFSEISQTKAFSHPCCAVRISLDVFFFQRIVPSSAKILRQPDPVRIFPPERAYFFFPNSSGFPFRTPLTLASFSLVLAEALRHLPFFPSNFFLRPLKLLRRLFFEGNCLSPFYFLHLPFYRSSSLIPSDFQSFRRLEGFVINYIRLFTSSTILSLDPPPPPASSSLKLHA